MKIKLKLRMLGCGCSITLFQVFTIVSIIGKAFDMTSQKTMLKDRSNRKVTNVNLVLYNNILLQNNNAE